MAGEVDDKVVAQMVNIYNPCFGYVQFSFCLLAVTHRMLVKVNALVLHITTESEIDRLSAVRRCLRFLEIKLNSSSDTPLLWVASLHSAGAVILGKPLLQHTGDCGKQRTAADSLSLPESELPTFLASNRG